MNEGPNSAYPFILRRPTPQSVVPPRTGATATPLLLIRPDIWQGIAEFSELVAPTRRTQLGAAVDDRGDARGGVVVFEFYTGRMALRIRQFII